MIWALIPSWLKRVVAGVVLIWGVWVMGQRDGAQNAKLGEAQKDAAEYKKTTERMQDADTVGGDDAEWLRKRGKR